MSDPFSKYHRKDFPFEWRGKLYAASQVTVGLKEQYCDWVLRFSLQYAAKALGAGTPDYKEFQKSLFAAPPTWGIVPSEMVQSSMTGLEGRIMLMRLILNVGPPAADKDGNVTGMDDQALLDMMADEVDNPAGPFAVVMARLRETTDPKATSGLAGATPTPATASSPSSSTNPSTATPITSAG